MKGFITNGPTKGTWYLRYDIGHAPDGKRLQRRETFRGTKAEAQSKLRARLTEIENGTVALERLTIKEIADRWLLTREHQVGVKTFHRYKQIVEQYIVPDIGTIRSDKFRPAHVDI